MSDDTQPLPTPIPPSLAWGAATDTGQVRTENEDDFVAEAMVFGVADGMGGHQAGEVASRIAAGTLRDRLGDGATHIDVVVASVVEANAAIFQAAHSNTEQRGMGTTLTALVVLRADDTSPGRLALVNVGDSRTYVYRNNHLRRATVDHSYVQELVATGHITEAEARTHPRRNIVTRALGIEPTVRVDTWVLPMVRGDRFVLCSDGLVDEVPDHEIAAIVGGVPEPQRAADELVAMANRHGGRDNITVIVVDVLDGIDPPAADADLDTALHAGVGWAGDDVAYGPVDAEATALVPMQAGSVDHTAVVPVVPATGLRRRFTLGAFLFLLALAVIATVTITLVAVVVNNNNDSPPPTSTTTSTTTTTSSTTTSTTTPPTTVAPPPSG